MGDVPRQRPEPDRKAVLEWSASGRHTYRSGRVPAYLGTRRQLRKAGLSVAGLRPAGWLHYSAHHGICPLYDRDEARPVRPLTDRQREILAAGRALAYTELCTRCGQTRVPWRAAWADRSWLGKPLCDPCVPIEQAAQEQARAERERRRAEAFVRRLDRDRAAASAWAREVLADPSAVVLDTETTGLEGAYLVEIAIIEVATGRPILDTLVHPQEPIPADVIEIHGITDDMVRDAPCFAEVLPQIEAALSGRRVVIYNSAFDVKILHNELCRHWHPDRHLIQLDHGYTTYRFTDMYACGEQVEAWTTRTAAAVECAMEQYASWYGEWHSYWGDYTWQRLGGGHRAAGDCRTVIERLREMAAGAPAPDHIGPAAEAQPVQ